MTNPNRLDLREIDKAEVYIGDDLAARLVRQRGEDAPHENRQSQAGVRVDSLKP